MTKTRQSSTAWLWPVIAAVIVTGIVVGIGSFLLMRSTPAQLSGASIAAQIRDQLPADYATCPQTVPAKTGKIVDCVAQKGTSAPVMVRVTQDDSEGHYHIEATRQRPGVNPKLCQIEGRDVQAAADNLETAALSIPASAPPAQTDPAVTAFVNASTIGRQSMAGYKAAGCMVSDLHLNPVALTQLLAHG